MKNTLMGLLLLFSSIALADPLVGVGVPLSGDGAWMGKSVLEGVKLYLSQHGLSPDKVLRIEDVSFTQTQTTLGITAVKRLVEVDKAQALILCVSPVVNASAPFIDENKIPSVAIVGADTAGGRTHQVRLWPLPDDEMKALAENFKGKRVAILFTEQDAMLARKLSLEKIAGSDLSIVYSSAVELDSLNSIALKVVQSKPDVVILFLMPGKNGLAARKLRELNYKGLFAGTIIINAEDEVKLSGGTLNGALFPDAAMTDEFIQTFKKEYGHYPGVAAAPGYDAAKLIFEGLKAVDGNAEDLNKQIHADSVEGALGKYELLKDGSNSFKVGVALRKVGE